ncbi:MAG TPA: hypothetical protein VHN80_17080 [Kineosporiaceae bacterium]|nr:hypothetical protein [Kineosporiaceae bacterium]
MDTGDGCLIFGVTQRSCIYAAANQHTHAMTGTAVAASSVGLGQKGRS